MSHSWHLLNNPVELSNGTCFMEVTDYTNKGTYVIMLNPANGTHSAKKFADKMSIYDVIVPCVSSGNQIISYLDRIIADKCYNFDMMPDSLIKALNEGNRLLVIHNIH